MQSTAGAPWAEPAPHLSTSLPAVKGTVVVVGLAVDDVVECGGVFGLGLGFGLVLRCHDAGRGACAAKAVPVPTADVATTSNATTVTAIVCRRISCPPGWIGGSGWIN